MFKFLTFYNNVLSKPKKPRRQQTKIEKFIFYENKNEKSICALRRERSEAYISSEASSRSEVII